MPKMAELPGVSGVSCSCGSKGGVRKTGLQKSGKKQERAGNPFLGSTKHTLGRIKNS